MPEDACATCRTNSCSVVSVTTITLMEIGTLPNPAVLLLLSRVLFLGVTMAYYYHLGRKPKKIWVDYVILPGRGQLSTDYKCGVRRFGLLFDWSLEHYFARECSLPPSMGSNHCYPQYSTNEHIPDSPTRTINLMVKVNYTFCRLWGEAPVDTHSSFVQFWVLLLCRRNYPFVVYWIIIGLFNMYSTK